MISQSRIIDCNEIETIKEIVLQHQKIVKSKTLGIEALFWLLKYDVKVLDKKIGKVVVQGIVYYDFIERDYYFDIEHQFYYY